MGSEGAQVTRREALILSTGCLGTLAGVGTASAATLPPLEASYFAVTPDGDLRFALVYENEVDPLDLIGTDLLSVSGDTGLIELTAADRIGWGESMVTSNSLSTASSRYDLPESTEETLAEGENTTFDTSSERAKQAPELVKRPEDVVTGRITDAVSIPDVGDRTRNNTIPNIDLPEVDYVGGPTSDRIDLQEKKHVQLPDGFIYHLPVTNAVSGALGDFSPVAAEFLRPDVLDCTGTVLVPPISHRTNFALTGLRSSVGARGRPYLAIASWAEENSIEEYNSAVWEWAEQNVVRTLRFLGGPPGDFLSTSGLLFAATIAIPIGAPILTAAARSTAGVARSLRLVDQFSEATDGIADAKGIAEFYDGLEFDENEPVSAAQADRLSEAFRDEGPGIPAEDVSTVCTFTSTVAVQSLAAADDEELPDVVASVQRLLDRQEEEISNHRAVVDDVVDVTTGDVFETARQTRSMLDEMLSSIESERELLRRFRRDARVSSLDLSVDVTPETPDLGEQSELTVRTGDSGLSNSLPTVDRVTWRIVRTDLDSGIDEDPVVAKFDGALEDEYTFYERARYSVTAEVFLENYDAPLRASTEVEAIREVTARFGIRLPTDSSVEFDADTPIPTDQSVDLDGSTSVSRTDTSIVSYDWTIATETAYQDAVQTFRQNRNANPTLDELHEELPNADTAIGEVADYRFDEGEYRIILNVRDDDGNTDRASVKRVAGDAVRADIAVDTETPYRQDEPLEVSADLTRPRGQAITDYEWTLSPVYNFDAEEARTASGESATFAFEQSGEHWIQLRVTDEDGVVTTDRVAIPVSTPAPGDGEQAPDPDVRIDGDPPGETDPFWIGESIRFELEYEPAGTVVTDVTWEFREPGFDGNVVREASGEAVTVEFSQSDAYQANVTVELASGETVGRTRDGGTDFDVYAVRLDDATDIDGDGLKEDVNGNGRVDFGDVVTFQRAVESPKNPALIDSDTRDAFSFSGNDLIGEADVDALEALVRERIRGDGDA